MDQGTDRPTLLSPFDNRVRCTLGAFMRNLHWSSWSDIGPFDFDIPRYLEWPAEANENPPPRFFNLTDPHWKWFEFSGTENLLRLYATLNDPNVTYDPRNQISNSEKSRIRILEPNLTNSLPIEVPVIVHLASAPVPTHVLYIYSSSTEYCPKLQAVHGQIITHFCLKLPRLTWPRPLISVLPAQYESGEDMAIVLPLVPLDLPHPDLFTPLLAAMYGYYIPLYDILMPAYLTNNQIVDLVENGQDGSDMLESASSSAIRFCSDRKILSYAPIIRAIMENMIALGMYHDGLRNLVSFSWDLLIYTILMKEKSYTNW